jgi:azurin
MAVAGTVLFAGGVAAALAMFVRPETPVPAAVVAPDTANAPVAKAPARTVTLTGHDNMTFGTTTLTATPGETLTIVLQTVSNLPASSLVHHNFVLLSPSVSPAAFVMLAAQSHGQGDHVPAALKHAVIASTEIAKVGEDVVTTFRVPDAPGRYVFLCSVPGHYGAGMKGILEVAR